MRRQKNGQPPRYLCSKKGGAIRPTSVAQGGAVPAPSPPDAAQGPKSALAAAAGKAALVRSLTRKNAAIRQFGSADRIGISRQGAAITQ